MVASGILVAAPAPSGGAPDLRTTALAFRQAIAGLLMQSSPGEPIPGILPAPSAGAGRVTGDATQMKYHVGAAVFVLARGGKGAYILALPEDAVADRSLDGTIVPAGDPTNPRQDRVFSYQPDPELSDSGVAGVYVAIGTPSSIPPLPSIPAGALELGRKTIAPNAANTLAGAAFTNLAARTGLNSNVIVQQTDPGDVPDGTVWVSWS